MKIFYWYKYSTNATKWCKLELLHVLGLGVAAVLLFLQNYLFLIPLFLIYSRKNINFNTLNDFFKININFLIKINYWQQDRLEINPCYILLKFKFMVVQKKEIIKQSLNLSYGMLHHVSNLPKSCPFDTVLENTK